MPLSMMENPVSYQWTRFSDEMGTSIDDSFSPQHPLTVVAAFVHSNLVYVLYISSNLTLI